MIFTNIDESRKEGKYVQNLLPRKMTNLSFLAPAFESNIVMKENSNKIFVLDFPFSRLPTFFFQNIDENHGKECFFLLMAKELLNF